MRRVPLGLGLLLFISPVLSLGAPAGAPGDLEVHYQDGEVILRARQVPLDAVVGAVADHAGLRLVQHTRLDETVSIEIEGMPLPDLLRALLDQDSYQLYHAGRTDSAVLPGTLWIFSPGTAQAFAATAFLEVALMEGDFEEKKAVVRELRRLASSAAVEALSLALADSDARIREAGMEALAAIGTDEALAALGSVNGKDEPRALQAIGMAGGRSAVEYLRRALHDEDPTVRSAALAALDDVESPAAIGLIREAMDDPDPMVRERVIDVLETIDDEAAFQAAYGSRRR